MSLTSPLKVHEQKLVIRTMIEYINAAGGVEPKKLKLLQVVRDNDFIISRVLLRKFGETACINGRREGRHERSTFKFENMQIINADTVDSWGPRVLTFSPDILFMMSSYKYARLIRELEIYANLDSLKFIAGLWYSRDHPDVIKAVNEFFKEPDMVFSDGTWIVKL